MLSPISGQWSQHVIDPGISKPAGTAFGDTDGDGGLDAAAKSYGGGGKGSVLWYRNNAPGTTWTEYLIDNNMPSAIGLVIKDVDGDSISDLGLNF